MKILVCVVLFALVACADAQHKRVGETRACVGSTLEIGRNRIWVNREGTGTLTVVFEAGFGNDSSVWSAIAPRIRATGVQTFVYDRAGMGKSTIDTAAPYSFDNDVDILRTALSRCGIAGPVVMVGHSYGGAMSLLAAVEDPQIKGIVLIDSMVPNAWPPSELAKNMKVMRAQYDEIREKAPALANVAIPWAEALPETLARLDAVVLPESLPVIDIVAEKGQDTPESAQLWRDAHERFTMHHPQREYIFAAGSSHKVMVDQPELVVAAISKLIAKVSAR